MRGFYSQSFFVLVSLFFAYSPARADFLAEGKSLPCNHSQLGAACSSSEDVTRTGTSMFRPASKLS
jgi:hypothetical protein